MQPKVLDTRLGPVEVTDTGDGRIREAESQWIYKGSDLCFYLKEQAELAQQKAIEFMNGLD